MSADLEHPTGTVTTDGWLPVRGHERILTLDALRGVAILGVLVANVLTFASPAWSATTPASAEGSQVLGLLVGFLIEGKFYVLFSLLFGMGLALQSGRAKTAGRPFARVYVRRLAGLFVLGIAHGVLLYSGDILALYAVLGVVGMALCRLRQRTLFVLTVAFLLTNVSAIGVHSALNPGSVMPAVPDWQLLLDEHRSAVGSAPASQVEPDTRLIFLETMSDELRIFQSGSWKERTRHRILAYTLVGWPLRMLYTSWRVLGFFALGVFLVRGGIFLEREGRRRRYLTWLWVGLVSGLLMQMGGGAVQMGSPDSVFLVMVGVFGLLAGGLIHALAYACGVAWLCLRPSGRRWLKPVAAVGRMALTNYLTSSAVFALMFYGGGLGLMGRVSTGQALLVALALYAVQMVLSSLWTRWYRFGPFEWLWRSVTYWRLQPMRVPSAVWP